MLTPDIGEGPSYRDLWLLVLSGFQPSKREDVASALCRPLKDHGVFNH